MKKYFLLLAVFVFLTAIFIAKTSTHNVPTSQKKKIVIAHRGLSGYLPEHTLEAYSMAYAVGSDYIEPDLVMTKDGVLICLHDIFLERTTDVENIFPDRNRADGRWYAADFNLEEIKMLSVHERADSDGNPGFPNRFRADSKGFQVPTFVEVIEMIQELNRMIGRTVGIYPETKRPAFHDEEGLPLEKRLLEILSDYNYKGSNAPVYIQSFDPENLKEMRFDLGTELPLIQLIGWNSGSGGIFDWMVTEEGLDDIAAYANGIAPDKSRIEDDKGMPVHQNALVKGAHARGLVVHPYTFRADLLPTFYKGFEQELDKFYHIYGVDGIFTDNADDAVEFVRQNLH